MHVSPSVLGLTVYLHLSHGVLGAQTVWPTKQAACAVGQHPAQQQQSKRPS